MRAAPVVLLCLLLLVGPAAADDKGDAPANKASTKPLTTAQAADAVLAAIAAEDDAAIAALSKKLLPDPWLVADELCRRAQHEAALRFARGSHSSDTERLPAYVLAQQKSATPASRHAVLDDAAEALRGGRAKEMLTRVADVDTDVADVVSVRILFARAIAHRSLKDLPGSSSAYLAAGRRAAALGWLSRAATAFFKSGEAAYYASKWDAALEAWNERLEVETRRSNDEGIGRTLSNIGVVYDELGKHREALDYQNRALAVLERIGEPGGIATALGNIGILHEVLGDLQEALRFQLRALAIKEKLGIARSTAITLSNIGNVYQALGDFAKALKHLKRALALDEQTGDKRGIAASAMNIGVVYASMGNYPQAVAHYQRALEVSEEAGNRVGAARALANLGMMDYRRGALRQALVHQQRALKLLEELGDGRGVAATLANIGVIKGKLSEPAAALKILHRAKAQYESLNEAAGVAAQLTNIGTIHFEVGRVETARDYYSRALAAHEALGATVAAARDLTNLAAIESLAGDYRAAFRLNERALAMFKKAGSLHDAAVAQGNLGNTYARVGAIETALHHHKEALTLHEHLGDKYQIALAFGNLGTTYKSLGDMDEALACFRRARALATEVGDRVGATTATANEAAVHGELGDAKRALKLHQEVLSLKTEMNDQVGATLSLNSIGAIQVRLGMLEEAHATLKQARESAVRLGLLEAEIESLFGFTSYYLKRGDSAEALRVARIGVEKLPELVRGLSETEGSSARERWEGLVNNGLAAAIELDDVAAASDFIERGRSGALLESLGGRNALRDIVVSPKLREIELVARSKLRAAQLAHAHAHEEGQRKRIKATRAELKEARIALVEVMSRIQREAKAGADIAYAQFASLGSIQESLNKEQVLVSYALLPEDVVALVVTRDAARLVTLAQTTAVTKLLDQWQPSDRTRGGAASIEALRKALVAPLGLDRSEVLIAPSGQLGYVPFSLLMHDRQVAFVPSGTAYRLMSRAKSERGAQVLAFGDPDYESEVVDHVLKIRGGSTAQLQRLPATREEVEAIADVQVLHKQATESNLQEAIAARGRWRAVHFACHGLVDPERPMLSALALTADEENDGFLTALEIFRMKIPADLVVMSACETGKGRIYKTEGIVGLTRAFLFAGAPRVICSLWKVDDEATRALMVKFYELWNPKDAANGLGAAAALKKAQDFVRNHPDHPKWKHPYYWAAWVLWGVPDQGLQTPAHR